jgi:probable F420-dependent oxidoreductase
MAIELGKIGIWKSAGDLTPAIAAEIERLGYGAIWIGGSPGGDLDIVSDLLAATERIAVATGIVNMWQDDAAPIAAAYHRIAARFPDRFLLGVGIGHPEATKQYAKPYDTMVRYLDELDAAGVPVEARALAALGPKVLKLAADRTLGAHPYLTTPEHTREARGILGAGPLLAPEQKVVLDTDPASARTIGRAKVANPYLHLTNYVSNLRRSGWSDEDIANDGSDKLVDVLALHGDAATVARGVTAHLDAGADHVGIQVLGPDPMAGYRSLAEVLLAG